MSENDMPSMTEINGRINALETQRNQAQNQLVMNAGFIAQQDERIKTLELEKAALQQQLDESRTSPEWP